MRCAHSGTRKESQPLSFIALTLDPFGHLVSFAPFGPCSFGGTWSTLTGLQHKLTDLDTY